MSLDRLQTRGGQAEPQPAKQPCAAVKAENELLRLQLERSEESRAQLIRRIVVLTKQLAAAEDRIIELLDCCTEHTRERRHDNSNPPK